MLPAIVVAIAVRCSLPAREKAVQWQPWEFSLEAKKPAAEAMPSVEVTFQGPEGQEFTNHAFTDDGIVYSFRAAFPAPGEWIWISACSGSKDRGLNNRKGKVEVLPYEGDNPL
ncbi:MAG: hypothetical protein JXA55_07400, partial [Bacteroidales bacterium]|nr:hypothetical protein [Bacteroidales bacterium]